MEEFRQAGKRIDASDVVSLLREVYPDGVRGRNEAEALIAFDREFTDPAPEWRRFMAEAVADHLLCRSEPVGFITEEKATWLIRAVAPAGRIATLGGVQALIRTIELAESLPVSLISFLIRAFRRDIISGEGPVVQGRKHFTRVLDSRDVALLRRILEAGKGAISAEEAEALFDLHDAVAESDNHDSFADLFYRAITNYLKAASGCEALPRKEALAKEPRRDTGNEIAAECCAWLSARIMRDGRPTMAERALLTLIDNSTEPDPSLRSLFDRAA